jgi:hypothetical protein
MTNLTLSLRDLLRRSLDNTITNRLDEVEVNIHELLASHHQIAIVWSVAGVLDRRPDLTTYQAWQVLQTCERRHDVQWGVTWDTIDSIAEELFGPRNSGRVERCNRTIEAYGDDIAESNLIDFLADAMHWCETHGHSFRDKLRLAEEHHAAETSVKEA